MAVRLQPQPLGGLQLAWWNPVAVTRVVLPKAPQGFNTLSDLLEDLGLATNEGLVGDVLAEGVSRLASCGTDVAERLEHLLPLMLGNSCAFEELVEPVEAADLLPRFIDARDASRVKSGMAHVVGEELVERLDEVVELPPRWPEDPAKIVWPLGRP